MKVVDEKFVDIDICEQHELVLARYRKGILKTIAIYRSKYKEQGLKIPVYQCKSMRDLESICNSHALDGEWALFSEQIKDFVGMKALEGCFSSGKQVRIEIGFKTYLVAVMQYYLKIVSFAKTDIESSAKIDRLEKLSKRSDQRLYSYERQVADLLKTVSKQQVELETLKRHLLLDQTTLSDESDEKISDSISEMLQDSIDTFDCQLEDTRHLGMMFCAKMGVKGLPSYQQIEDLETASGMADKICRDIGILEIDDSPRISESKSY